MPKRSSKNLDRGDENETAFDVVREATEGEPTGPDTLADLIRAVRENPDADADELAFQLWPRFRRAIMDATRGSRDAAAELGSKGGKKGGPARAKKLSPDRRTEIARKAARARWDHGSPPPDEQAQ